MKLLLKELNDRKIKFVSKMDEKHPDWQTIVIIDKVNQYYFTGTIQDAVLLFLRGEGMKYFVRRSFERAVSESPIKEIYSIKTYRDIANVVGSNLGITYLETEVLPFATVERLKSYFLMKDTRCVDTDIRELRATKTDWEIKVLEKAGALHNKLFINEVPKMLCEGISEAEFTGKLLEKMFSFGHHGTIRYHMFQTEFTAGQVAFGENLLCPTNFDGPGSARGYGASAPANGDPKKLLKKGDLVFLDTGFGLDGYHSDKTQVYRYNIEATEQMQAAQKKCREIEARIAKLLRPGIRPSQIYHDIICSLNSQFLKNFMGFSGRNVRFLGHGVGLNVDDFPVIAEGFNRPLEKNMVLAVEPKVGIENVGMVGVEEMYVVTENGGRCLTGGSKEIIFVN